MTNNYYNLYISPVDDLGRIFRLANDLIENENKEEAKSLLLDMHYADLAHYIDNSSVNIQTKILEILSDDFPAEVLSWLDENVRATFSKLIGTEALAKMLMDLQTEDVIEIIDHLDSEEKANLISLLPKEQQKFINEGLRYPENSVGRIMETNFISFPSHWTISKAIDMIQKKKNYPTDLSAAVVVDSENKPVGILLFSQLIKHHQNTIIKDVMNSDIKLADAFIDQDELSYAFRQYSLSIAPITNYQGKLIGVVSLESILHIIDRQAEEELMHLGGVNTKDIYQTYWLTAKHRFPWLFVNLITACFTTIIITFFEDTIAKMITLAAVMPIALSISSNSGTQTVTVIVRALSNRDINDSNSLKIIIKETIVCLINSSLVSLCGILLLMGLFFDLKLSFIFAVSLIITCAFSGFLGAAIPIFLSKIDLDPAISSSVFLTALTDIVGVFSFLFLAYLLS